MALSISPTLPVIAAQSATATTGGAVLLPGTVVNAAVLKAAENLVQIAIANLAMDVLTEVPLTAGQTLQLAVSQNEDGGVRLTIVGQGAGASAGTGAGAATTADYASLQPNAQAGATSIITPVATTTSVDPLTPLQRMALTMASETAATRQQSLSPLFANLTAAAASNSLPPALQQAVTQVLAQQASLEPGLSGSDIQTAFQKSGLFLEASLAAPPAPAEAGGIPDLKAALIVLCQALASVVETVESPAASPAAASTQAGATRYTANNASPPLAPTLMPEADRAPQGAPLQPRLGLSQGQFQGQSQGQSQGAATGNSQGLFSQALLGLEPGSATAATVLNLLQEALQEIPRAGGNAATTIILPDGRDAAHADAAAADPRRTACGAAGGECDDPARRTACNRRPSPARGHGRRASAADAIAGRLTSPRSRSKRGRARQSHRPGRAALEFRDSVRDPAGHCDGAVRDLARRHGQ